MNINPFMLKHLKSNPNFPKLQNLSLFIVPTYVTLISKLKKHKPYSTPFLLPVKKKDAPNYCDVILSPIDLSTMNCKAENGMYKNKQQFLDDLKLMQTNCRTYNIAGLIVEYGDEMYNYGVQLLKQIQEDVEGKKTIVKKEEDPYNDYDIQRVHVYHKSRLNVKSLKKYWICANLSNRFGKVRADCINVLHDALNHYIKKQIISMRVHKTGNVYSELYNQALNQDM